MWRRRIVIVLGAFGVVACAGVNGGARLVSPVWYTPAGFHRGDVPYDLLFKNPETLEIVSPDWIIGNWQIGEGESEPERRDGPAFLGYTITDYDGDGSADRLYGYYTDVELRNRKDDGSIWISVDGLSPRNRDKDLSVFIDSYVAGLTGEDFGVRRTRWGWVKADAKTFAAAVLSARRLKVDGMDAVVATISLANVDSLALDPNSRYGFVRVLLVRVPGSFEEYFEDLGKTMDDRGLMMVGYFNTPAFFDAGLPALDAVVGQLRIADREMTNPELHDSLVAPLSAGLGAAPVQ